MHPSHKLFHSFCIRPDTRFDTQQSEENVYLVLRAHPITLLPVLLNSFFMGIILVVSNAFFPSFFTPGQMVFADLFFTAFIGAYLWHGFINWYFNVGIISDQRVVDVDFSLILYKEVTYTLLSHIEDVTSKSGGFFNSLFNFGNLFVQTAGTEVNTEFMNIPHPSSAAKIIDGIIQEQKSHGKLR